MLGTSLADRTRIFINYLKVSDFEQNCMETVTGPGQLVFNSVYTYQVDSEQEEYNLF